MKNIKILIATHKEYDMPNDKIYLPIFVGSNGKDSPTDYQRDDEGINISYKNKNYCELTGLYWAWQNLNSDYIGLAHYRRHFAKKLKYNKSIAQSEDFENVIEKDIIIVPKKRKYYIETLYSHYSHSHYEEHLIETRKIIEELYPQYLKSYDKVMKKRSGYMFNMFVMSKENLDQYCKWLFTILANLEKSVEIEKYDDFQGRLFGRVSELLFNVWIDKNEKKVVELPWMYTEKINKISKIISFLQAKFINKRFKNSF